jgi:putative flippase GtrA
MNLVSIFQRDHETSTSYIRISTFEHKIVGPALSIAPRVIRVGLNIVQNFSQLLIMYGWTKRNDAPLCIMANLVQLEVALILNFWGRRATIDRTGVERAVKPYNRGPHSINCWIG